MDARAADHHQDDPPDVAGHLPADQVSAVGHPRDDRADDLHLADPPGDRSGDHDQPLDDPLGAHGHRQDVRKYDRCLVCPLAADGLLSDDPRGVDDRLPGGLDARRQNRPEDRDVVGHRGGQCAPAEQHQSCERAHQVEQVDLRRHRELSGDLPVLVGQRAWP